MIKINAELKTNNIAKLSYKLINDLLYFDDFEREMRLYVSTNILKHKVFKLTHNEMKHFDYIRTHEKLIRDIYIFNMFIKLHKYLRHYPHCQLH